MAENHHFRIEPLPQYAQVLLENRSGIQGLDIPSWNHPIPDVLWCVGPDHLFWDSTGYIILTCPKMAIWKGWEPHIQHWSWVYVVWDLNAHDALFGVNQQPHLSELCE